MRFLPALLLLAATASATPAWAGGSACAAPLKPMLRTELFFGRTIGDRFGVTDRLWQSFVDRELTPRFPNGFTITDARGQWREEDTVMREASKVVIIVTADNADARQRIAAVTGVYVKQFRQKSVGMVAQAVCAAF